MSELKLRIVVIVYLTHGNQGSETWSTWPPSHRFVTDLTCHFSAVGTFSLAQTRKCSTKLRVRHLMSPIGYMNSLGTLWSWVYGF